MKNSIPPFKVFFIKESNYLINGGRVINYFNQINFRRVKNYTKSEEIPIVTESLSSSHIYPFPDSVKKNEIFLMCSFKSPSHWVPGLRFCPIVDECWLLIKETEIDNSITIYGSKENSSINHIRFDSAVGPQFGYACNLGKIAEIERVNNEVIVRQSMLDDYLFSLLFDFPSYFVHNNNLGLQSESYQAYSLLKNNINPYLYRGYAITSNISLVRDDGLPDNDLGFLDVPPQIGRFVENHPEF